MERIRPSWLDQADVFELVGNHPFQPALVLVRQLDFGLVLAVQWRNDVYHAILEPLAGVCLLDPVFPLAQHRNALFARNAHEIRNFVPESIRHR